MPRFPRLDRDMKTDVLIIGGGIAGILCAWQLQRRGVDCVLIEADRLFRGISRNTTAKITSQHGLIYDKLLRQHGAETAMAYWEINSRALKEYKALASGIDCDFEIKDNYIYSRDAPKKLERELTALETLDIPGEFAEALPLPIPTVGAVRFRDQAQFHPLKFLRHLAKDLRIFEETPAREFLGNTVITDRGQITASKIIVATHFPMLNKHGSYFLKLYQDRSYVLAMENGPDLSGMYLDAEKGGFSFRNYGELLLLGGGSHRTGKKSEG